jgi:hypothetical protein
MDKELQKAILAVMLKKDTQVDEAKKPLHPNQQKIDVHEPEKDEITAKDFEMLRSGKKAKAMKEDEDLAETKSAPEGHHFTRSGQLKRGDADQDGPGGPMLRSDPKDKMRSKIPPVTEDITQVDEAGMPSSVIKHKQKLANMSDQEFAKAHGDKSEDDLKQMAWRHGYGKMSSHYVNRVNKGKSQMEEVEIKDDADETILVHTPIEYELAENYMFGDYLTAAKSIVGEEKAIELANYAFNNSDTDIFVEQFLRSDIEAKVKAHENMGHKVSTPKYSTKSGKPHAEYVVTDKEGVRRKYIHHGANRKTENMGPVGKRDEE